jgi:hypothetical protein
MNCPEPSQCYKGGGKIVYLESLPNQRAPREQRRSLQCQDSFFNGRRRFSNTSPKLGCSVTRNFLSASPALPRERPRLGAGEGELHGRGGRRAQPPVGEGSAVQPQSSRPAPRATTERGLNTEKRLAWTGPDATGQITDRREAYVQLNDAADPDDRRRSVGKLG